ncbi:MAG: NUDIX domain-containing protein [Candidatus Omnitrophica bacterium]|nr:NUDIX domain-containing protein [Candidatus Omnitrophota bacterium]
MEKLQYSSGGVVYRKTGAGTEIVILTRGQGKVFCLPKGKIEQAETPEQAALREIKEETGLTGIIEKEIGKIKYSFELEKEKAVVNKTVTFYLVKYISGDTKDHDTDAEDVRWLPVKEALKIMTYPSERSIVEKAKDEDRL